MRLFCTLLVVAACTLTLGCGKMRDAANRTKTANDLKVIGLAFHSYCDKNTGKAPTKAEDLEPFMMGDASGIAALKSGKVVFFWGVTMPDLMKAGPSEVVLAYEKDVPEKGGAVLMGDASVRQMTPDDFKAAKKAKS